MTSLKAFVGHSFTTDDEEVVRKFLKYFDQVQELNIGLSWEHAEPAEAKELAEKVLRLMDSKNLFIGICTKKEAAILPIKLTRSWLNKKVLKAGENDFLWKTSDWIIQEIGLAVGKGMDLMLLVESGLRQPGGLQGNKEYISFDRQAPEKSFGKVLEMIQSLIPKARSVVGGEAEVRTALVEKGEKDRSQDEEWITPKPNWTRGDFEFALMHLIAIEDKEGERKVHQAYLESKEGQVAHNRESWDAFYEFTLLGFGKGGKLTRLDELAETYSKNSQVLKYRAKGYQNYGEHEKAARFFEAAAQKAENRSQELARYGDAAWAFTKAAKKAEANRVIEKMKAIVHEVENGDQQLLYALRGMAEIEKSDDQFFGVMEKLLDLRPGDTDLRFKLAYKYSEGGEAELALYHYLKIPYQERAAETWNNLGVQFEHFDLDNKSVEAYRKSEGMGETLAMSNLALKLIRGGFLKEAEDICNRAIKVTDYHKNVGYAITRIRDLPEAEEKKEEELINKAIPLSEFFRDYGRALAKQEVVAYGGRWKGPECELTIRIKGESFTAEGQYERSVTPSLLNFFSLPAGASDKIVKYSVKYDGTIVGRAVKAVLTKTRDDPEPRTLLGETDKGTTVLMHISDSFGEIRVLEKTSTKESKFYRLNCID